MSQTEDSCNAYIRLHSPTTPTWGDMVCDILRSRTQSTKDDFTMGEEDAIETLKAFDRTYASITMMFRNRMYMNTHVNAKKDFIFILVDILHFIIRETQDRVSENALVYASSHYERNLHQRFIHKDGHGLRYMEMLIQLGRIQDVYAMFRETRVQNSLQHTWSNVCHVFKGTRPQDNGALGDFQDRLEQFLKYLRSRC
jgi:hypothetical protein